MRVLCVAPYFYPKPGGLERYAYEICKRIAEENEVRVICSGEANNGNHETQKMDGMDIFRLPISFRISNTPISFRLPFKVRKLLDWCDVVYAHSPVPFYADIALIFRKKPSLLVYHSGDVRGDGVTGVLASAYLRFEKRIISSADVVAGVSEFVKRKLKGSEVITPGVDHEFFKPVAEKRDHILFVGQLRRGHEWKGLDVLLQAAARIDCRVVVVGDGDLRQKYERLAERLNISASFRGYMSDTDMPEAYSSAKLLVLPSKTDQESFGMALLEANACGTGVVGTRAGGIPWYIRDGKNGILTEKNTVKLAHAISSGLEKYRKLGRIGRIISRDYSWENSAKKTERILNSLI